MNRSIALIGAVLIVLGFGLVAYPIVFTGGEKLDLEQELGFLVAPVGLVVVMLGALAHDPELTTVGGTFGNPEANLRRPARGRPVDARAARLFNPHEPVDCRYCRTVITADLAQCPRCARPRDCRSCGRPLGVTDDRVTCPACGRTEGLCNCPLLVRPAGGPQSSVGFARRRP
jgi:RNA polymerase subunit RPABC4/transcription elongation factor Spt4